MEYASKAVGTAGLTTGIIGTALGVLGGGASMLSAAGNVASNACSDDHYVTRYEMGLQNQISSKDGEIALLKSEQFTEEKIADVYERLITRINADRNAQAEVNTAQAVYNATNNSTLGCMQNQVAQLMSLTALKIPNTSVCPGWGPVTVTPNIPNGTTLA